jgi:hypothetical protein
MKVASVELSLKSINKLYLNEFLSLKVYFLKSKSKQNKQTATKTPKYLRSVLLFSKSSGEYLV